MGSIPSILARCRRRPSTGTGGSANGTSGSANGTCGSANDTTQETHTSDHITLVIDSLQHSLEKRIHEVEQRQQQYQKQSYLHAQQCAHQQFQPYHVRLQESIQQIEIIKGKIHTLEATQQSLLDNQVIAISP
jgi:TolA-binding protein